MGESARETQDGTLRLRASESDSCCTLALSGELDMSNTAAFAGELARLEETGAVLELDLSKLEFIDSTGIAILVGAHQRLGERLVIVRSESPGVRRVFSLTGLDEQLRFR